jgi:DNA-binding transcriptional ArsR family regulator
MHLWDNAPTSILNLLLGSTAHNFYFSEILDGTGLARATVSSNLRRLREAGVLLRQKERCNFDHPNRALRVYYTVNPSLIDYLRLEPRST